MKKKIIGLLGGIGPESTGNFYLKLIKRFANINKPKHNTEYPHIIINSIPAPDLILNKGTNEILSPYNSGLKFLEKSGADIIGILCNTAHVYFSDLQKGIKKPIINLNKEVLAYLRRINIKSVTVLGTSYTMRSDLYKFKEFKYNNLTELEMDKLTKAITLYNLGQDKEKQKNFVQELARKYSKMSDCIILGCTEVALMVDNLKIRKLDPMDALIDVILKEYAK